MWLRSEHVVQVRLEVATRTLRPEFRASERFYDHILDAGVHDIMAYSELSVALSEFKQALSPEQTAKFNSFSSGTPTADDVIQLTNQVIKANASQKSRLCAARFRGLLDSIQQYCTVIDTCVGPNQIAALIWGSIKLVLLVSSNFTEYFDKLSKRVAQLSNYYPRFFEYEKLFPTSVRVQQALSDFYAIVVKFCSKALRVVQEKAAKRYLKSVWKSFKADFKDIEENIIEAKDEIIEELRLASEQEAQGFRRLLTADIEENKTLRMTQVAEIQENKDFRSQQTLVLEQSKAQQIHKIQKDEERKKIRLLLQIQSYDYRVSLYRAQELHCKGTCNWLFSRSEFKKWIDQTGSKHLWCHGIPGCGKTVLLGYIVNHLKLTFSAQDETAVIYYFFDSSQKESLKASTFLRSILHQAIRLKTLLPDSQRRLESLFMDQIDCLEPATSELEELFLLFYGKFKIGYLLIDGLDEADEIEQRNVKSFLKEVQKMDGARILAITHAATDMSKVFTRGRALQIEPEDVKDDIESFVQSQLDKYAQEELSDCSQSVLELIKQKLVSDAEGMFLFADLQLKAILDVCDEDGTPDRIPDLLEALPRKITELYSFLLERLAKGSRDRAERAKKAFQWVVYSKRPLSISELEEAISITTDQKSWKSPSSRLDISRLAKLCGNLVKYYGADKTVTLAHHTVESFLLSYSDRGEAANFAIDKTKTEQYLADICLTYLSFPNFHKALTRTSDTEYVDTIRHPVSLLGSMVPNTIRPLALNALRGRQRRRADPSVDLVNILRTELSVHQSKTVDPTFRILDYCKSYWHSHSRYIDLKDTERLKIIETFIRRSYLPKEWMPWSSIRDEKSLPFWKMFIWAIRNGHATIFHVWQKIITTPQSIYWENLWQEEGQRLFTSACATNNLEQLQIILDAKGEDDGVMRPSLSEISHELVRACHLGNDEVVERLLQEKVNVYAVGEDGKTTALQAAAEQGYLNIVERLLQKKADTNIVAEDSKIIALQAAAERGHLSVIERLLQEKVDVNAVVGFRGRTALQAAAEGGYFSVVERLLQEKADVNTAAGRVDGRTALQAAAERGHLSVVERLLQEKADVNAIAAENSGRTALQAAAGGGYLNIVERLLQEKADVNAAAGYCEMTALQAAAGGGHLSVVERLLQEKADVNTAAARYGGIAALQAAAGGGYLNIVERLLQEKADINAVTGYRGKTALQAAAGGGYLNIVERLLQEKAYINAVAQYGETTALQAAIDGGHEDVIDCLREAGAII